MSNEQTPETKNPRLFGCTFQTLAAFLVAMIVSTQIYAWLDPIMFAGHDLRLLLCALIFGLGAIYSEATVVAKQLGKK